MAGLSWILATSSKDALSMDKDDRRFFCLIDDDKWIPIEQVKGLISNKQVKIKAR